jgi:hypothetical protein
MVKVNKTKAPLHFNYIKETTGENISQKLRNPQALYIALHKVIKLLA